MELIELFATMQRYRERAAALLADNVGFPYKERLGYNDYGQWRRLTGGDARCRVKITGEYLLRGRSRPFSVILSVVNLVSFSDG